MSTETMHLAEEEFALVAAPRLVATGSRHLRNILLGGQLERFETGHLMTALEETISPLRVGQTYADEEGGSGAEAWGWLHEQLVAEIARRERAS